MPEFADSIVEFPEAAAARAALERYADPVLRRCAARFGRERLQDESADWRERILDGLENPVVIDRSLKALSPDARRLLRIVGIGRRPIWRVPTLVEANARCGGETGAAPILELLEAGMAFPILPSRAPKLASFESWIANAGPSPLSVTIAPLPAARAQREPLTLPKLDFDVLPVIPAEVDGLEWLLRMTVAWQVVREAPLRLTQQGGFFKRDLDRLKAHGLLAAAPAEHVGDVPDAALVAIALAIEHGLLTRDFDQVRAAEPAPPMPPDLGSNVASLWSAVVGQNDWDPRTGWLGDGSSPLAADAVLAIAMLAELPADQWALADDLDSSFRARGESAHAQISTLLLGLLHQMRIVQAAHHKGRWWVRLSQAGRELAAAQEPKLPPPAIEQTLVVQPNLEIIVYRQGMSPALIGRLTRVAEWKALGLACTLGLTAESVYRGLESGETLPELLNLFERHSTRPLADTVVDSLRSWASKRERVLVYPSAFLLEFRTADDLDHALRRGLVEHRLTDRIGLVGSEDRIDYQQFRLSGTRDYLAADEVCVDVPADGLTIHVNEHKSDLLLESELRRFAEPLDGRVERAAFQVTLASLRAARNAGLDAAALDSWYRRRAGQALPASARLLLTADEAPPFELGSRIVVRVPSAELADGLAVWPDSAKLLGERLAPTLFAVPAEQAETLRALLGQLGVRWESGSPPIE